MLFGAPIFFFALIGLSIPLIIHLWSKNTRTTVDFGSLKFVKETETKTTKHLFPSELLLLLLRILLLIILVLLFVQPFIYSNPVFRTVHLIDPSLKNKNEIIKTLPESEDAYWLSANKTPLKDSLLSSNTDSWTSIEAFSSYDSIVVYAQNKVSDFKSDLPNLPMKVHWMELPSTTNEQSVMIIAKNETSQELSTYSDELQTMFELKDSKQNGEPVLVTIFIKKDDEKSPLYELVNSSLKSIQAIGPITLKIMDYDSLEEINQEDWLIWLSNEPHPHRERMIYKQSQLSSFQQVSQLTYSINEEASLEDFLNQNIPLQIESAIYSGIELDYQDLRKIPTSQLAYSSTKDANISTELPRKSLANWGWVLFIIMLLIERSVSTIKIRK